MSTMTVPEFEIRPARSEEVPLLGPLERRAGRRFAEIPAIADMPDDVSSVDELSAAYEAGRLWVAVAAGGEIVGFAYAAILDGCLHLEEVSVLPEHGRRGVGTGLVRRVCCQAVEEGLSAVALSTFRDVPWNEPFYAALGFVPVEQESLTPGLRRTFDDEARRGLPVERRTVMRWPADRRSASTTAKDG